jgi:hypothetical protein
MVEAKGKELAILPFLKETKICEYSGLIAVEEYN